MLSACPVIGPVFCFNNNDNNNNKLLLVHSVSGIILERINRKSKSCGLFMQDIAMAHTENFSVTAL